LKIKIHNNVNIVMNVANFSTGFLHAVVNAGERFGSHICHLRGDSSAEFTHSIGGDWAKMLYTDLDTPLREYPLMR